MTLNGHTSAERQQIDTNHAGGKVASMLADYQNIQNGGDGYLRKIRFDPGAGRIDVSTYSPTSATPDQTGTYSQFTYTATFNVPANLIAVTGLHTPVAPVAPSPRSPVTEDDRRQSRHGLARLHPHHRLRRTIVFG